MGRSSLWGGIESEELQIGGESASLLVLDPVQKRPNKQHLGAAASASVNVMSTLCAERFRFNEYA